MTMATTPAQAAPGKARDVVVRLRGVGKCYHIYDRPQDRLKQALLRWSGRRFFRDFWALRDLDLDVRAGEAVGIVGRNGSGKSTLLQMIAGTLAPSVGSIEVAGRVAALLELGSGFNPDFSGRENVYLNGAILGLSRREVDERFDAIAGFADIGAFLDQPVKTYSSGMLVRLAFAVQVQVEPDVLIVDEALAVGDALFQKRCYQRLAELRERGVALLLVTHDLESVRTLTGHAVMLHEGRKRFEGSPADVLLAYRKLLHEEEARWMRGGTLEAVHPKHETGAPGDADGLEDPKSFGDRDAQIVRVELLGGDGSPQDLFYPLDAMRIRLTMRTNVALDKLNIGVRIRNRQGVKIYSWGTLNQDMAVLAGHRTGEVFWHRRFGAGEECTVELSCPCTLGADTYEVQVALTHEQTPDYTSQRTLHWRDEAAFFRVVVPRGERFFGGVANMGMRADVVA